MQSPIIGPNGAGKTTALHASSAATGLATGYVALYAAKGARLHRKRGMLLVYAMMTMGLTGAGIPSSSARRFPWWRGW